MAIDMTTENSSWTTSPRISFSRDLCQQSDDSDKGFRLDSSLLDSNSDDFDFCIGSNSIVEAETTTSAEELFLGGLIRPVQLQERFVHTSKPVISVSKSHQAQVPSLPPLPFAPPTNGRSKQENLREKEAVLANIEIENKNQSKSFWSIKRSSSLHCENSHKKSSFWSLPLLSRSNSTGSVPNPKQGNLRENQKQNSSHSKQHKMNNLNGIMPTSASSAAATASFYVYPMSQQKHPLRKNYLGSNGNGLRINPVINMPVPSSHISKGTANLLGLGSFFRNGRDKKSKK
ncbi:hypothetical protein ACH5RR_024954 [Cinchona calisaya]|uniref:Uncharacterized protein n=1 Tax=Cinchona calisaya TaxID=153742 RepID=A0ABD2Z2C7_9GENT